MNRSARPYEPTSSLSYHPDALGASNVVLASNSASATSVVRTWETLWNSIRGPLPADLSNANFLSSACVATATPRASAFDLQLYAEKGLASIRASGIATPTEPALKGLRYFLQKFVMDNGPTPQVGSTQSGSIELQWLAGGIFVAALFDHSGDYNICAFHPSEGVVFDEDVLWGDEPTEESYGELSAILEEMKPLVKVRPANW